MCHSDDSRPPAPPSPGEVASHGPVELTSADGTRFGGYRADPATPNGLGVVVLPDIRGLHPFYRDLTQRFAQAGFATIGIDYFGRTAGIGDRDDSFDWQPHLQQVRPEQVAQDVGAARAQLSGPVFTVGFCFGGSQSWRLAASDVDLAGVIGFYGKPAMVQDVIDQLDKPMLMLVAGADAATSLEQFHEFDAALTKAGAPHEMQVYAGAPHSFFDRAFAQWQPACEDAWRRILDFTARVGAGSAQHPGGRD